MSGDWGIVDDHDRRENKTAIILHMRIMSVYFVEEQREDLDYHRGGSLQHVCDAARGILGFISSEQWKSDALIADHRNGMLSYATSTSKV